MDHVTILPPESIGYNFIPTEHLPAGEDEYYLRNQQVGRAPDSWRTLRAGEIEELVKNNNTCGDWDAIRVTDEFEPSLVKNNEFFGMVRIGRLRPAVVQHHDLRMPVGITNSRIISCDIGDDPAVHNVRYLGHYIIRNRCILLNIHEMHTTNYAKFGNGIVKDGEDEKVRVLLEVMNETGGRSIAPFDGMTTADAYIWARYREDEKLQQRLLEMTQTRFDSRRGYYGVVGEQCVMKNCRIIKDADIGPWCYIKGANKLKNITIHSNPDEQTQIGEGVELVNGIVGYGAHIFYGCKAVRFIMGNNTNLKYGARLLNSFLGDNSTVSCCEMLNNLIFPAHEQHHNNSFLIASLVMGQSNLAAGATIGSNHNSRANDNEVRAGRGFWPGLCTSIKHSCCFASFTLLAKGDYPAELNIPLPFSLCNNNTSLDRLEVMPAFWWLYNMYALARNTWKFQTRDKRKTKIQHIEFDSLAPDTVEEIIHAHYLLERWTGMAQFRAEQGEMPDKDQADAKLCEQGRALLKNDDSAVDMLEVRGEGMEKSNRPAVILKVRQAYHAYGQMLYYYAVKNLLSFLEDNPDASLTAMNEKLAGKRQRTWINCGGQLVAEPDVDSLRSRIREGSLQTWDEVHRAYDVLWEAYPQAKQRHAYAVLCEQLGTSSLSPKQWNGALDTAVDIQHLIAERVYTSRNKDLENPFRRATFLNDDEMAAVVGTIDENSFIQQVRRETGEFEERVTSIQQRG